jgi:hypothetical protein
VIALVFPVLEDAQIYKWKDKNGVTRYSDTRPTDTLKVDGIGKPSAAKPKATTAGPTAKSVEKPTKSVEQEAAPPKLLESVQKKRSKKRKRK